MALEPLACRPHPQLDRVIQSFRTERGQKPMSTATIAPPAICRRYITAAEFERMVEAGIMAEEERVELLDGEFYEMAPIGLRHVRAVRILSDLLNEQVRRVAIIDVQNPILLNDKSRPQPDVTVL